VNDGTIPVAEWLTPLDGAALPAGTAVSLTLRVHAIDNIKVEKVVFTSSAFPTQTLTAPTRSGDIYEQVVSFTTPAAGTPFTVTATVSDSEPLHDVVLPLSIDPVPFDVSAGDAMLTGDASIEAADVTRYTGRTIVVSGNQTNVYVKVPLTLKNLIVINGGHVGDPDRVKLDLTIKDHLFVDADSSVDMSGKGFLGGHHTSEDASLTNSSDRGMTLGDTTTGHGAADASASYGGVGGESLTGATNTTYGSIRTPADFGSGGAGQPNGSQIGGNGGGAIALHGSTAAGDLSRFVVAGAVRADGETGTGGRWGAGSGGSVLLSSRALITGPSSRITANGGDDDGADNNASGAGGGRMSVSATDRFDVTDLATLLQVRGGRNLGSETRTTLDGGAGTLFLQRPGSTIGELIVSSFDERFKATMHLTRYTPIGTANGALTFDAITVASRALARFDNDYTVADAGKVTHDASSLIIQPADVPSVSMTTMPAAGADVIQGASITATLNGSSIAGVGRIAFAFSAGTPSPVYFDYSNTISPTNANVGVAVTAATGNATLKAIVTDRAGRTAETAATTFNVVANSAPVITAFDVTPSSLQTYAGHTITVAGAATDDIAVTSLALSTTSGLAITSQSPVTNGTSATRSFSIAVPLATAGGTNIDLKLSASDNFPGRAATTQTKNVAVLADTNPPVVSVTSPAAGATFDVSSTATIPIRAVVVDAEVGVSQVWATIGNSAQIPMVSDPSVTNGWKADPPVPSVDGTQTVPEDLVVSAMDYSNNSGSSAPQTVNIHPVFDLNGATVSWICPSAGALFPSGYSTKLRVSAVPATSDNGVTSVVFYIGDSTAPVTATLAGNNIYEATVQLPTASDGTPLPLRVEATTIRNNKTDVRVTATIITGSTINVTTTILDGDTQYDGKSVIITGGTTTIAGAHTFARLAVLDGASVTHAVVDATNSQRLDLQVTGAVYVSCGGSISTTGKGYQDAVNGFGRTWPNTTTGGSFQGSAGSHGGEGGHGVEAIADAYGSVVDPNEPGGAGGHAGNYLGNQGGGIVRIRGAASITVDGTIAADGLYASQLGSGAGAGGSIRLDATAIGGAGSIHANGASGTTANFAGGGGRVALYYQNLSLPRANVAASGGDLSTNFGGGAGTIYLYQSNASGVKVADELRAVNNVAKSAGVTPLPALGTGTATAVSGTTVTLSASVPEFIAGSQIDFLDATGQIIGTSVIASRGANGTSVVLQTAPAAGVVAGTAYRGVWALDQVTVLGAELLQATTIRPALVTTDASGLLRAAEVRGGAFKLHGRVEASLIDVATATIENNSYVTHATNSSATVSRLVINAGTVTVDATSRIDASGKGYQGSVNDYGITWPFTTTGGSNQGSAGSHGGEGGHGGSPFAVAYGSAFDPNEPGGAGGHGGTYAGNEGGGIIRIKAQSLNLDGSILANGFYASQLGSGSGAGGSIRIDAGTFTGTGAIHANGADAAPANFGGGGGRIAVYATNMTLPRANVTALGGTAQGAPGTVLFRTGSQLYGDLIVDNGGRTTSAKTTLTALGINPITSSNATSVTNANAHFDAPNSLGGINLIFGNDISKSWPIVGNTATTVTVTPDAAFAPPAGGLFRGLFRLDSLKARFAAVQLNDLLQLTNAPADVDATASLVTGNLGAPLVDASKFSFTTSGGVQLVAGANAVTDPDTPILVTVTNGRTNVSSTFSVASGAPFSLYLYGVSGDPISIHARDSHTFALQSAEVSVGTLPTNSGVGSVTFQPSSLAGGARTVVTVTLTTPAPAGGAVIGLSSSNSAVAPVPANVTVASGSTTTTFNITTISVATQTSVIISASYVGTSQPATLTVIHDANPPSVTITAPVSGAIITEGQPIAIEATIIDAEVGVKLATAVFDGVSYPMTLDPARTNVWTTSAPAPDVDPPSDVPKQITVTASDFESNQSAPASVTVNIHPIIDALAPTLTWVCGNGSMYPAAASATFTVKVTPATGDQINSVSITITGPSGAQTFPMTLVSGNYQYTYTVPSAADGTVVTLRAVATTFAGKTNGLAGTLTIIGGTASSFPFPSGGTINATDTQYENGTIIVTGGTLTIVGTHHFARLAVINGGTVVHPGTSGTTVSPLDITATSLYVGCNSSIAGTGRGYALNTTYPGATFPPNGTGGSHVGTGGLWDGPTASTFGSVYQPREAGGGGESSSGLAGGGVIHIQATSVVLDGAIRADGVSADGQSRGGAGGSVWISTATMSGAGIVSANGSHANYGSGAGGSIAIEYTSGTSVPWTVAASSATSNNGASFAGGAGTIYVHGPQATYGDLTIDNAGLTGQSTNLPSLGSGAALTGSGGTTLVTDRSVNIPAYFANNWVEIKDSTGTLKGTWRIANVTPNSKTVTLAPNGSETIALAVGDKWQGIYRFDNLTLRGVRLDSVDPVRVAGTEVIDSGTIEHEQIVTTNLRIKTGAVLTHRQGSSLAITTQNELRIDAGGTIDVTGRGYTLNTTYPGATLPPNGSGGSHIGTGGLWDGPTASTFGSVYQPREAGGGGESSSGQTGGGVIRIQAASVVLDGSIHADGVNGGNQSRGAAGGSVWISTTTLSGAGSVSAKGSHAFYGTGAGGSIAIEYTSGTSVPWTLSAKADASDSGATHIGGAGTVYVHGPQATYGDLTIDNGGQTGQSTNLPSLGSGTVLTGSGGATLVTDRTVNIPAYFASHWVEIKGSTGLLKGTWRIATVTPNSKTVTLAPNGSETIALAVGDKWQGIYQFDNLTLRGVRLDSSDPVRVNGTETVDSGTVEHEQVVATNLRIKTGAVLTHRQGSSLTITTQNELRIDAGGTIDVTGRGYTLNTTYPGATLPANGSGGSHIGTGGLWDGPTASTFGSVYQPREAGGGGESSSGQTGGGVIRIQAASVVLDGSIHADAVNGGNQSRGAAGGSVWISTATLSGAGSVSAKGSHAFYGTGAGGSIAIEYTSGTSVPWTLSAKTDASDNGATHLGGAGTIYVHGPQATYGDLLADNNGQVGQATELPSLGSGAALTGSGGTTLVTDRTVNIPAYFASHWVEIKGSTGLLKGTWRIATVTPNSKTVTLAPNGNETMSIAVGDTWAGLYRFDNVTLRSSTLKSSDRIEVTNPVNKDSTSAAAFNSAAPKIVPASITVSSTASGDSIVGAAGAATDSDQPVKLIVTNLRSAATFSGNANADGSFVVAVSGLPGDTFSLKATDSNAFAPLSSTATLSGALANPITSFTLSATTVSSGSTATATVALLHATATPATITLSSTNTAATVPATATVLAGAASVQFTVNTSTVSASTPVTLTASYAGSSQPVALTVTPSTVSLVSITPALTSATELTAVNAVIMLSGPAPAGATVTLTSSDTTIATVPAAVTVPLGATSVTTQITTLTHAGTVTITGTYVNSVMASLTVTCTLPQIAAPASVALDTTWIDDALPTGAALAGASFTTAQAALGTKSLSLPVGSGVRQASITGATTPLSAGTSDKLVAWVLVNPCNPPREILFDWTDGTTDYRATWGEELIDTALSHQRISATIPTSGAWTRFEAFASALGAGGKALTGLTIKMFDGEAYFDAVGTRSAVVTSTQISQTGWGVGSGFRARNLASDGSLLVVTNWGEDVGTSEIAAIFDISNPASPVFNRSVSAGTVNVDDMAIRNGWGYAAAYDFCTIDLITPTSQKHCASMLGGIAGVTVSGNYAFAARSGNNGALRVYDVSNPANPFLIREQSMVSGLFSFYRLFQLGTNYLVATTPEHTGTVGHDVVVIDRTNINSFTIVADIDIPNFDGFRGQLIGNTLYLAGFGSKMAIVDLSNPSSPQVKSVTDTGGATRGATAAGDRVVTADGTTGAHLITASNPAAPVILVTQPTGGNAWDALLNGTTLYVVNESGLVVMNGLNVAPTIRTPLITISATATTATVAGAAHAIAGQPTLTVTVTDTTTAATTTAAVAADGSFTAALPAHSGDSITVTASDGAFPSLVAGPVVVGAVPVSP